MLWQQLKHMRVWSTIFKNSVYTETNVWRQSYLTFDYGYYNWIHVSFDA